MQPDEDEPRGLVAGLMRHNGVIGATLGLIAWFVLLYYMFGDVL